MGMAKCETCGNDYDKAFVIVGPGDVSGRIFDSFECAIQAMAPACAHCGCRVIGHGVEAATTIYCCAHCARMEGLPDLSDRSETDLVAGTTPKDPPAES
jgi:hypothetical protein